MASTQRQIPFSKYLQVRAVLVSHLPTKPRLSLRHSWQMRGGEIALPCQLVLSMGPGGDARKQSWALPFAPGPQRATAGSSSNCFIFAGPPISATSTERQVLGTSAPQWVSLGALGWPSPTLDSLSQLSTVQSLKQLSAVPSKLSLKAKGLYLEMYGQDRKESLFLFLSPCKRCRKIQEGVRKTCTPLLCQKIF